MSVGDFWQFASHIDRSRLDSIIRARRFEDIVTSMVACARRKGCLCWYEDPGAKNMPGHCRLIFRITVDQVTGDQFFSSPVGYRAAYAHSPEAGETANRQLIQALRPLLLKSAGTHSGEPLDRSLQSEWAKVWIWQKGGQFDRDFYDDEPAIRVPLWLTHRAEAIQFGLDRLKRLPREAQPICRKAVWGVRLHGPISEIEVIGAWVNEETEIIMPPPPEKLGRSLDIHRYGFA